MLECGLPSMYYLKNHYEEPTIYWKCLVNT